MNDIQTVAGWSTALPIYSNLRSDKPYSQHVASLLSADFWQVLRVYPSDTFISAVHVIQREALECVVRTGVPGHVSVLALALTSCLTLCRLRRLQVGGRKARDRARRLCHSLPPVLQSALARPGEADLCQALELFGFTLLQARCIQDPFNHLGQGPDGLSFVYQLGSQGLYIGQGALV